MTYIKRIHNRIHKHMTSILKYAVLALSVTLTATLEAKSYDSTQMNCLALVGYHEAKGESDRGMIAVMQVTMNRVKSEKLQGVPLNYTKSVSENEAAGLLGDGWTVDVVVEFLKVY